MSFIIKSISVLLFFHSTTAISQIFKKHQWKDRVLLVLTNSHNQDPPLYTKQLNELRGHPYELNERKLVIYQVRLFSYTEGLNKDTTSIGNRTLISEYSSLKIPLKVVLIGLDGSIKFEKKGFTYTQEILEQIDQMPIRRQELRTKN
ncbi:DUF4174 domain-containing protein [uncultured Aquimarina sp.]|uniref:DUF4174 domain-containing protein n=1 Tax=uncultured Aquimarina sp. TaxID=575652 RepID=UPI0026215AEF|nr:DUF4174 domain-containing protein [uncultured Aquimarina sp.]